MSEWARGYRAALSDVERIAQFRGAYTPSIAQLIADLAQDGLVIEHALKAWRQRRRLRAAQEEPPLLFEDIFTTTPRV